MQENEHTQGTNEQEIDIDYVYGRDDYNSREVTAPAIEAAQTVENDFVLSEMRSYKNASAGSIKAMMLADDLAMDIGKRPKLGEMSEEHSRDRNRGDELMQREPLSGLEKEEMNSKPNGLSHEHSRAIYNRFVDEQQADDSRRGFMILLLMTAVGVSVAALTYFLKLNRDGSRPYMDYLPIATLLFSLFMLIKSKFCKVISIIYFALYTPFILGPGLYVFARVPENQIMEDYILNLILYVLTALCSLLICLQLASNKIIAVYYSYSPPKNK